MEEILKRMGEQRRSRVDQMITQTLQTNIKFLNLLNKEVLNSDNAVIKTRLEEIAKRLRHSTDETLQLMRIKDEFDKNYQKQLDELRAMKAVQFKESQLN